MKDSAVCTGVMKCLNPVLELLYLEKGSAATSLVEGVLYFLPAFSYPKPVLDGK